MKILIISARYPPYHFGGYELRCKNIIDELFRRGHEILVITSNKETASRVSDQSAGYRILRKLHIRIILGGLISKLEQGHRTHSLGIFLIFVKELLFDLLDTAFIDRQIVHFQPDAIYLGHITILTKALMPYFAECHFPIICDEGGSGLIDSWEEKGIWYKFIEEYISRFSFANVIKPLLVKWVCAISAKRLKPQWSWPADTHIFFNSELNRRNAIAKGVPIRDACVLHSGINTLRFSFLPKPSIGLPLLIFVPGRIEPRKGQIDAVRLLAKLGELGMDAKMIFIGEKWVDSYYREVVREINILGLGDRITFMPMVEHDKIVDLYHQADICFFPSYYRTGLSRIPMEAMACGCPIISYGNEGSDEIIRDRRTGFLVSPADYSGVAGIIRELVSIPEMVRGIVSAARKDIEQNYSMEHYVDRIEETIKNAVGVH